MLFFYVAVPCGTWDLGFLTGGQTYPHPHWKGRVLTTELPKKSQIFHFIYFIFPLYFYLPFWLFVFSSENGNPLQCSCLENPRDGGAWWAAVYGVAQSRTRLKRLSSSSSSSEAWEWSCHILVVLALFSFLMHTNQVLHVQRTRAEGTFCYSIVKTSIKYTENTPEILCLKREVDFAFQNILWGSTFLNESRFSCFGTESII